MSARSTTWEHVYLRAHSELARLAHVPHRPETGLDVGSLFAEHTYHTAARLVAVASWRMRVEGRPTRNVPPV